MILRPYYITELIGSSDSLYVKILLGVRCCGKSTILDMISDELKERGISEDNIIVRKYTDFENSDISAKDLYRDIKAEIKDKGRCYLMLNEAHKIKGWEKVVKKLRNDDVDIYVTVSNSKPISSWIYTPDNYFFLPFHVSTLSFKEYLTFKGKDISESKAIFDEYIRYGGFPLIALNSFDTNTAYQIVEGIYASVIMRDISKNHNIRNQELFDRVVKYIIENIGKTFSANTIVKFLKSEKRELSVETVYKYLKWLEEAFIIYPCKRYDMQGKAVLKTFEKYYLSDISIIYALKGYDIRMISGILENIIFLEMKRRDFDVYVAKNRDKEIDFIAMRTVTNENLVKFEEKIYVQVCVMFPEDSDRKTADLMEIRDNYRKYVVCYDSLATGNYNGIKIVSIADFLLMEKW